MKRLRHEALNTLLIVLGICSAGMELKGFLLSSNFIDGGVTGVSMLLAKVTAAPLSVWLPVVNVPFIVLGLATVHFPDVTRDLLRRTDVETEGHGGNGVYTEKRSHREEEYGLLCVLRASVGVTAQIRCADLAPTTSAPR